MEESRDVINNRNSTPAWMSELLEELIQEERDRILKDISTMEWRRRTVHDDDVLDIERAKQYPISQMLTFNRGHKTRCIWHDDSSPSLHYYAKDNRVHCFVCNQSGDAIDVCMKVNNVTFKQAVMQLST